jgi:hypothetical protein
MQKEEGRGGRKGANFTLGIVSIDPILFYDLKSGCRKLDLTLECKEKRTP